MPPQFDKLREEIETIKAKSDADLAHDVQDLVITGSPLQVAEYQKELLKRTRSIHTGFVERQEAGEIIEMEEVIGLGGLSLAAMACRSRLQEFEPDALLNDLQRYSE